MFNGEELIERAHGGQPPIDGGDAVAELLAVHAYQPRADWEEGRKSSPNAVTDA